MPLSSPLSEQANLANIDHRYNNAGRAWQRDQVVNEEGQRQLGQLNKSFARANTSAGQDLARRGQIGGSQALRVQSRLSNALQDSRAGISGNMMQFGQQLQGQDEQARQGLASQFNSALDANTNNQRSLQGLSSQLSNQGQDLNSGLVNGMLGAAVGAYDQSRTGGQQQLAVDNFQTIIPKRIMPGGSGGKTMLPSASSSQYNYLNF